MRVQDILPVPVRRYILRKHQNYLWSKYLRQYISIIDNGQIPDEKILKKLIYSWGNQGFSSQINYLQTMIEHALSCKGAFIECGSGLSILLVGVIAKKRNIPMI